MEPNEPQNQNQQTTSTEQNLETQNTSTTQVGNQSTEAQTQTSGLQNEFAAAQDSNKDIINLYDQVLREKEAELQRLRNEVSEKNKPAPLSADEQKQRFFNNPMDVLREEMTKAMAPVLEITQQFRSQSTYDNLKQRYRNDPRYAQIFPRIEGYVDQIMSTAEKNENTLKTAVLVAIGALQTGEIKDTTPAQNQNRQTPTNDNQQHNNMTVPAHLRSTPPSMPTNDNRPQKPVLTELERRLAKERGMSEEDWALFRDMPSNTVATHTSGGGK